MSVPPPGGEYLFVVYPNATDSEMIQLSDLKIISGLREVSLADCHGLTDIGFKHLPPLPELRILRLDGCAGITETGLSAAVTAAPNLRGLGLRDCRQLTDRWLREVCRLKGLGDLTLTGCRVISDIASSLGEAGVTRAGLERVKVILPGCRIHGAEG